MLNKLIKLFQVVSQNNSGNNHASNQQLAVIPITVILLISDQIPSFILNIPATFWVMPPKAKDPIQQEITIASYLTPRDKKMLSQTCKAFYFLYKDEFLKQRHHINTYFKVEQTQEYQSNDLKKLLSDVALGEFEQAEKIWKNDPALLTLYGTIYHPNCTYQKGKNPVHIPAWQNPGRYCYENCTPWQIALMNSEFEEAEEMGKFMTFDEKQRQFGEAFPTGKIEKYDWDLEKAKQLLEAVFAAVIVDRTIDKDYLTIMNENTQIALKNLYHYLNLQSKHKIGLVFDENLYVAALSLYEKRIKDFVQSNKWDQRSFWCIRIEEYIASKLGTGFLGPHAQGIEKTTQVNTLRRNACRLANGSSYFSFRNSSNLVPGFHFFVNTSGQDKPIEVWDAWGAELVRARQYFECVFFSKLMLSKTKSKDRVMQQYSRNQPYLNS